jgi:hypothetical protein
MPCRLNYPRAICKYTGILEFVKPFAKYFLAIPLCKFSGL